VSTRTTTPDPTMGWVRAGALSLGFVAVLWISEILDATQGGRLDRFGIEPRTQEGLWGVLVAPLLHGGFGHLEANSVPLLVLGFLVAVVSFARWLAVMPRRRTR
jgi:membrane associated rhomboid family serine protease